VNKAINGENWNDRRSNTYNLLSSGEVGAPLLNIAMTRDFLGNILSKEGNTYTYDGMNNLKSGEGETETYDELSNLTTRGNKKYTYQDTGADSNKMRMSSFFDGTTTYACTYDDNGNLTALGKRFTALKYDNLGRLREIDYVGGQVDKYWYNIRGLRYKKVEHAESPATALITYYLYIGNDAALKETYVNLAAPVKTGTYFNIIVGRQILGHYKKIYSPSSESLELFYPDDRGCRRAVISSAKAKLDVFTYSAWGIATQAFGSDAYLRSFTGKDYDASGLVYFNARYYDPVIGRFITEDPSRKGRGWYTYCGNNPMGYTDPSGLDAGMTNWEHDSMIAEAMRSYEGTDLSKPNDYLSEDQRASIIQSLNNGIIKSERQILQLGLEKADSQRQIGELEKYQDYLYDKSFILGLKTAGSALGPGNPVQAVAEGFADLIPLQEAFDLAQESIGFLNGQIALYDSLISTLRSDIESYKQKLDEF
jgi:RHS repeat-associated protein